MRYVCAYSSPLGEMTMESDGKFLTGLWFDGQKYFGGAYKGAREARALPVFEDTTKWLDLYFSGQRPDFTAPSAGRLSLPPRSMGSPPLRCIRQDDNVRRDRRKARPRRKSVRTGSRRRRRAQSHLDHRALPQGTGQRRLSDGIRRRHRQKARSARNGGDIPERLSAAAQKNFATRPANG